MLVVPNNIIKFITTVIDEMGMGKGSKCMPEEAINAVLLSNGTDHCTLGFLCKSICGSHISCCPSSVVIDVHLHKAQMHISSCTKLLMSFCLVQHNLWFVKDCTLILTLSCPVVTSIQCCIHLCECRKCSRLKISFTQYAQSVQHLDLV